MKNYHAHKSSLFLMELIIAIVFFALASAVCLQLFVKSHQINRQTEELHQAVNLAVSAAEVFRQSDGSPEEIQALLPELSPVEDGFLASFYDADFSPCGNTGAVYQLQLLLTGEDTDPEAEIHILKLAEGSAIYSLTCKTHLPNTL